MINETIILLTYYYEPKLHSHRLLKYVKRYLGAYLPWDIYLYEPLRKIFSRVILYDYLERNAQIGVKAMNEEVIALVREEHPKYVLWTSWRYDILESTLETIRKEGSIVVGWFFDDEWRFDDYSKWWTPYLDYCVTNAMEAVPKYKELGARVIQTIPNTGIAINCDWSNIEERYEVSFVGTRKCADRRQYIGELKKRGIPLQLFGEGWGEYVSFAEMIDIFKTSKINLNFSKDVFRGRKLQIKGRVFQACMAGGFMLTEYAPGIEDYFEIDKEVVCFQNAEEMIDKVNYYLNHDEERQAIAQAGWQRVTHNYTSYHMVSKVFDEIEGGTLVRANKNTSYPPELKMPMRIRKLPSLYHFWWGRTLMEEDYEGSLWKDELALSLSYRPFAILVWYYYVVSFLPSFLRPAFFKLFAAYEKLRRAIGSWLNNMCGVRRSKVL